MKRVGRFGYISIGVIFTLILSFTVLGFAQQSSSSQTTNNPVEMEGNPTVIDKTNNKITLFDGKQQQQFTLDSDTVIYRNGQRSTLDQIQFTDDVKLTFNSQHLVRYVTATSAKRPDPTSTQTQANNSTQNVNPNNTNQSITQNQSNPTSQLNTIQGTQNPNSTIEIRELQLHIDYGQGNHDEINYSIDPQGKAVVHINKKSEDQDEDIKDEEATKNIQPLIQQLKINGNMSEAQIVAQLESILKIDQNSVDKLELNLKSTDNHEIHVHYDSKRPKGPENNEKQKHHKK